MKEDALINLNISESDTGGADTKFKDEGRREISLGTGSKLADKTLPKASDNVTDVKKGHSVFAWSKQTAKRCSTLLTDELVPLLLDLDVAVEAGAHHVEAKVFARAQLRSAEAAGRARVHPLQGRAAL